MDQPGFMGGGEKGRREGKEKERKRVWEEGDWGRRREKEEREGKGEGEGGEQTSFLSLARQAV